MLIEPRHEQICVTRQCELLGLARSSLYYRAYRDEALNLSVKRLIDKEYMRHPFYGARRLTHCLRRNGYEVNVKRVRRLMREMGIAAIYPKPRLSAPGVAHRVYPYLLRDLAVTRPNQVWAADITYVPMAHGFLYLVAIIDWFSRYVVAWELSNTLSVEFCLICLEAALSEACPEIFNTDQGSQFTSRAFADRLEGAGIAISMDGKGRAFDNIFIERLWRSVKYEDIYLNDYEDGFAAREGLERYFAFFNHERPHQGLDGATPAEAYFIKMNDSHNNLVSQGEGASPLPLTAGRLVTIPGGDLEAAI